MLATFTKICREEKEWDKIGQNYRAVDRTRKCIYTADRDTKYFLARQQSKANRMSRYHGNNERSDVADSVMYVNNTWQRRLHKLVTALRYVYTAYLVLKKKITPNNAQ
jgi:hypothetical protein